MTDTKAQLAVIWAAIRKTTSNADFAREIAIMVAGLILIYVGWAGLVLAVAVIWPVVVLWRSSDRSLSAVYRQLAIHVPIISFALIFSVVARSLRDAGGLSLHLIAQQILLIGLYVAWLIWRRGWGDLPKSGLIVAGVNQFFGLWAVFLAATVWRSLPTFLIIAGAWGVSLVAAQAFFSVRTNRARTVLAASWALIVAELAWLFSVWLVDYTVLGLLLPQPVIVITSLSYCFASIYLAYSESKLSRPRLAEYLFIGFVLILMVASGISWNGI